MAGRTALMKRASFCAAQNVRVVLLYEHPDERMPCTLCNDPNCFEWANVLSVDGRYFYHIPDCQLEKIAYGEHIDEVHALLAEASHETGD
ncbi:hypothetical protein [Alicyclobacillus macrosporangiidus]|uniref:hypothetical protein n=1 Tax=Alicyclobacillus macrosporangiidus TaxID=392015 RepID=UPI00054DB03A|nr:hypothetical protein [Alicyclobacillus macrosporangiidus]